MMEERSNGCCRNEWMDVIMDGIIDVSCDVFCELLWTQCMCGKAYGRPKECDDVCSLGDGRMCTCYGQVYKISGYVKPYCIRSDYMVSSAATQIKILHRSEVVTPGRPHGQHWKPTSTLNGYCRNVCRN